MKSVNPKKGKNFHVKEYPFSSEGSAIFDLDDDEVDFVPYLKTEINSSNDLKSRPSMLCKK